MKHPALLIALLLSLGFNLGLLVAAGLFRQRAAEPPVDSPVAAAPRPPDRSPPTARPPGGPADGLRASSPQERFQVMVHRLELDPDQKERFEQIHRRMFEELGHGRARLARLREELIAELGAEQPSEDRLRELVRRMTAINAQLDGAMVRTTLETRQILEPAQEEVYLEHFAGQILRASGGRTGPPPGRRAGPGAEFRERGFPPGRARRGPEREPPPPRRQPPGG